MTDLKTAYNYLISKGFSQKLILERIKERGLVPERGREFSKAILSRIANGDYAKHEEVESLIIELYEKESKALAV